MESNFQKLAKAVKDLESISAMSEEDKLLLAGGYAEQLIENDKLYRKLEKLKDKESELEVALCN